MDSFSSVSGIAAPLPGANIDTDVIMPKQFLKGLTRERLARGVFFDLRVDEHGRERAEFVLNDPRFHDTKFLIVGPNFGCGSSREHAVWGLMQFGIRAIVGTTFGSIFFDNCFQNGLLAIKLPEPQLAALNDLCCEGMPTSITVDLLRSCIIVNPHRSIPFEIDPLRRDYLIKGLDSVAVTFQAVRDIRQFEEHYFASAPWIRPVAEDNAPPTHSANPAGD